MPLFKAFQWVQHIQNLMFFPSKFHQKLVLFLMHHSGLHFLRFYCDLVPKISILGALWRPAGHQMTPKIAQAAPKTFKKSIRRCYQEPFWKRSLSKAASWHQNDGFWDPFRHQNDGFWNGLSIDFECWFATDIDNFRSLR